MSVGVVSSGSGAEGHVANSQSDPVRPTADPSGQSFASAAQTTGS